MRLRHYDHDGRARFVTFCTHRRLPILESPQLRDIVRDKFIDFCRAYKVEILAYVVMKDHFHTVFIPADSLKVGQFIGLFKIETARLIISTLKSENQRLRDQLAVTRDGTRKLAVWQRRCFDRNCRSDEEVWRAVEYCHFNPVAANLAENPSGYEWSSAGWYDIDK